MRKILFDASVHLGQFTLASDERRIGCKNSQASISNKPSGDLTGVITFEENSRTDDVIWSLDRETQDIFYKFMDVFHSVKNIERIPLTDADTKMAIEFAEKFQISVAHALSVAVAVQVGASEIHTYYEALLKPDVVHFLEHEKGIKGITPMAKEEKVYNGELEDYYQAAVERFQSIKVNPAALLHQ